MQKQNQKLQSSKMMMALHKKCNSIISGPSMSILNATQKIAKPTSNASCVDLPTKDNGGRISKQKKEKQDVEEY